MRAVVPKAPPALELRVLSGVTEVDEAAWDALVDAGARPFYEWAWLEALEETGVIAKATGAAPCHLTLWRRRPGAPAALVAAAPAYRKTHSNGEFVYDWSWAGAAERAGIPYYPKLVLAVPLTPATGTRFLVAPGEDRAACEAALVEGAVELARAEALSSVHVLFPTEAEALRLEGLGFALRAGVQYHWENRGYGSYEDFLGAFSSKRRNQLRRERREIEARGITLRTRRGEDLAAADPELVYRLYTSTVEKYAWGRRYLNPRFFRRVLDRFRRRVELVEAVRDGRVIAGAFNVASERRLYGRYWGCFEEHPFLHFNVCMYHSIAECIARSVGGFEGGAGGEHKLVRGFEPRLTWSAHRFFHPRLDAAIRRFVEGERAEIDQALPALQAMTGLRH